MCDAFSFLEHEASSAHSCLCPRLPWAVQPDIGSLYSTFLGRQHQNKRRGCRERGQGAKPEGRTPAALGRKGEGRTSVWKEGLSALRLPQSTLAGSAWSLSSPQVAFIFPGMFVLLLGDAGVNPGLAVYKPESLPKLPGGPQRGLAALHSGSIWKCTRAISTVTRTNRRHCLSQARAAGGALSGRDSASQSRDFHASPAQLSSTHS